MKTHRDTGTHRDTPPFTLGRHTETRRVSDRRSNKDFLEIWASRNERPIFKSGYFKTTIIPGLISKICAPSPTLQPFRLWLASHFWNVVTIDHLWRSNLETEFEIWVSRNERPIFKSGYFKTMIIPGLISKIYAPSPTLHPFRLWLASHFWNVVTIDHLWQGNWETKWQSPILDNFESRNQSKIGKKRLELGTEQDHNQPLFQWGIFRVTVSLLSLLSV